MTTFSRAALAAALALAIAGLSGCGSDANSAPAANAKAEFPMTPYDKR